MGVPDLLRFIARSSPSALYKLPLEASSVEPFTFDFVFVDATNAASTVTLEKVMSFLQNPNLKITKAVVFALDSQRDRSGTSRQHRQTSLMSNDLDVQVQRRCAELQTYFNQNVGEETAPKVLMSGRNVYGEADYKLLSLHRSIVSSALQTGTSVPKFLFISEDSDVAGGLLCGPAPHTACIATVLRDTLSQIHILELSQVMGYIAMCVDVFVSEEETTPAVEETLTNVVESDHPAPTTVPPPAVDDTVVRRKKVDGPIVAVSNAVKFSDSSDDDDDNNNADDSPKKEKEEKKKPLSEKPVETTATPKHSSLKDLSSLALASGHMLHSSAVDFVFLFVLIMGNDLNIAPIVRGATKVDILSCWQTYCKKKFLTASESDKEIGRSIVNVSPRTNRPNEATVCLDSEFLASILESLHYSDVLPRPPVPEEIENATAHLGRLVEATVRYIVACDIKADQSAPFMLDTRPFLKNDKRTPSLTSVLWVLRQMPFIYLHTPLFNLNEEKVPLQRGQQDVGSALVGTNSASWAFRGNRSSQMVNILQFTALPKPVGFSVASTVSQLVKQFQEAPPGTPGSSLFSSLEHLWKRSVAVGLETVRSHCATGKFISPLTGTVANAPLKEKEKEEHAKTSAVYSFELRRMTPVLRIAENQTDTNEELFLKYAGLSRDYASAPAAPTEGVDYKRPRGLAMDDEDKKELKRQLRIAGKERRRVKGEEPEEKKNKKDPSDKPVAKKKRPGKKERQKKSKSQVAAPREKE